MRSIAADIDFLDMVLVGLFFESQTVEKTIKSGNATQVDYDNFRSAEPTYVLPNPTTSPSITPPYRSNITRP